MSNNCRAIILSITVGLSVCGCGFKSDLFIPGEPQNAGQLDSTSIESLKQQTLDSLKAEDVEAVQSQIRDVTEQQTADEGVPVNITPLIEEVSEDNKKNRDKNKLP